MVRLHRFVVRFSLTVMLLTLACMAFADEAPTGAVVVSQCGKTVALILVDEQGQVHGVPPELLNDATLAQTLARMAPGKTLVATVPCIKGEPVT